MLAAEDGDGQLPIKKLKTNTGGSGRGGRVGAAAPPIPNLCMVHKRILGYMRDYHHVHNVFPNSDSPEFYAYLGERDREFVASISAQQVTRAIRFLEECFRQTDPHRVPAENNNYVPDFFSEYLRERYVLSREIWRNRVQNPDDILEDRMPNAEAQYVQDLEILKDFKDFIHIFNGGEVPKDVDSVLLYNYFSNSNDFEGINQDRLVERIFMLQENLRNPMENVDSVLENPIRREIFHLAHEIWGHQLQDDLQQEDSQFAAAFAALQLQAQQHQLDQ